MQALPTPNELKELLPYLNAQERDELDSLIATSDTNHARADLTAFKGEVWGRYQHAPHLNILDEALMDCTHHVETGEGIEHLIVEMPPRHGKTQTISRLYPAWHLGRNPDHRVILTSYGDSLSRKNSRYARAFIRASRYRALFPDTQLASDSQAADAWDVQGHEGGMDAMGIGGGVSGKGGHLIIVDDPVKNREQAESLVYRDKIYDSFTDDFYTRREPGAAVVIVMTRWHDDDLVGRLLKEFPDRYTVLRLPAMAEDDDLLGRSEGQALWPERFPEEALEDIRVQLGSYSWAALYQQRPTLREGGMFKWVWFSQIVEAPPSKAQYVRYWDKAATADSGAYTAGVLMAEFESTFFVVDVVRGQWSALERESVIKQTAQQDKGKYGRVVIWQEQEPGSGGKESAEATARNLKGYIIRTERVTGPKEVRAEPFAAQCEAGNVKLVNGAWNRQYTEEHAAFPNSVYKDQVDASSGAFNKLAVPRREPKQEPFMR